MALYIEETHGLGVTQLQYVILRAIHHYPGCSQRRLSELAAVDRTTVGWVVSNLERKGLVRRIAAPGDRRLKHLALTDLGLGKLKTVNSCTPRIQKRILKPLTVSERKAFMRYLRKIVLANNAYSRAPLRPITEMAEA